jgi:hypothetical protein
MTQSFHEHCGQGAGCCRCEIEIGRLIETRFGEAVLD